MDIGKEKPAITIEPVEIPEKVPTPAPSEPAPAAPEKAPAEPEKVPA